MKIDFSYGRKILIKTKTRDKKKFTQKHSLGGGGIILLGDNFSGGNLPGRIFLGRIFHGGIFPRTHQN